MSQLYHIQLLPKKFLAMAPDGVMLSNGPGNPEVVECAIPINSRNFRENSVLWLSV